MNTSSAIAIVGIWIGVGITCISPVAAAQIQYTSGAAVFATLIVVFLQFIRSV